MNPPGTKTFQNPPSTEPPAAKVPQAMAAPTRAFKPTEAYQNRKKGRKSHDDSVQGLQKIIAFIQSRGEATPGQMAQELGMSRSTLTYSLKRLSAHTPGVTTWKRYSNRHLLQWLLGQKRLERLGAGQKVRYRLVEMPTGDQENPK